MRRVSTVTVKKRVVIVFLFGLLFFLIINIRLGYVQFSIGKMLTDEAVESWSRDITFEPDRCEILDTEGEFLAANISAPSVIVVTRQIDEPNEAAKHLANILDITYERAYEYLTTDEKSLSLHPERRKMSEEKENALRTLNMNGIYLAKDSKRHYPYGDYLAHVLGFTGIDNQGLMGLEAFYDDKLKGKRGSLSYFSDAKQRKIDR